MTIQITRSAVDLAIAGIGLAHTSAQLSAYICEHYPTLDQQGYELAKISADRAKGLMHQALFAEPGDSNQIAARIVALADDVKLLAGMIAKREELAAVRRHPIVIEDQLEPLEAPHA